MKLRNKVSREFFAIDEKTKQKNVDEEQLSYYSMNSHCSITVS